MTDRQPFEEPQLRRRDDVMSEKTFDSFDAMAPVNMKAIIDQMLTVQANGNNSVQKQADVLFNDMVSAKQRYDALAYNALARTVHNGITLDAKLLDPGAHEVASENISADIAEDPEDNEVKAG